MAQKHPRACIANDSDRRIDGARAPHDSKRPAAGAADPDFRTRPQERAKGALDDILDRLPDQFDLHEARLSLILGEDIEKEGGVGGGRKKGEKKERETKTGVGQVGSC